MSIFKSLRVRASQGSQYIPDLRKAVPKGFRGLPVLGEPVRNNRSTGLVEMTGSRPEGVRNKRSF